MRIRLAATKKTAEQHDAAAEQRGERADDALAQRLADAVARPRR